MKKFLIVILSFLTAVFFVGCGTYIPPTSGDYTPPSNSGNENGNNGGGNDGKEDDGNDGKEDDGNNGKEDDEGYTFTVTLVNGPQTLPEDMEAIWSNKNEVYRAKFVDGVAQADGLNGEYRVTLSELPTDGSTQYTYDCNAYDADNNNRDIEIKLETIISPRTTNANNGSDEYHGIKITEYGVYRVNLTSSSSKVFFEFHPKENGTFVVTSRADITANNINPKLELWGGANINFLFSPVQYDGGGLSGTFTKNFRCTIDFASQNLSDGTIKVFGVYATVNNIDYPVTVDFVLARESDYTIDDTLGEPVYANGPYYTGTSTGTWRYIYQDKRSNGANGETFYIQDESMVVFNPDDGFYHVGRADGPLLYARLSKDCQVFATISLPGGSWINQGFSWNELANGMVRLSLFGYNYSYMINGDKSKKGYMSYCNSDGAHPVNEQIKNFLQAYASNANLFFDGDGVAEVPELNQNDFTNKDGLYLQSDEKSMWLFACGYYR